MHISTEIDIERRYNGLPEETVSAYKRLEAQIYEAQRRFEHAERVAFLFHRMFDYDDYNISKAVNETYEIKAFQTLRVQLFKSLIIDLCAAILDKDNKTGSIRSILKELRKCDCALDVIKAYHSNTHCVNFTIHDQGLSQADQEKQIERERIKYKSNALKDIEDRWKSVSINSSSLESDKAKRMLWARNKIIAHYEKNENGLVTFDEDPPYGEGRFTFNEPKEFLDSIREYAYSVFRLVTGTEWSKEFREAGDFYAHAFWDRFKNGKTNLKPDFLN